MGKSSKEDGLRRNRAKRATPWLEVALVTLLSTVVAASAKADPGARVTAARVNGVYSGGPGHELRVLMLGDRRLKVEVVFDYHYGGGMAGPEMVSDGFASGEASLNQDSAVFKSDTCTMNRAFLSGNAIEITNGQCAAGFHNPGPDGTYKKSKGGVPTFGDANAPIKPQASKSRPLLPDLQVLADTVRLDRADALALGVQVQHDRQAIAPLASKHAQLDAALKSQRAELVKHLQAGAAAERQADSGSSAVALTTAGGEYQRAVTIGDQLFGRIAELRKSEDELANLVADAASAANQALASSKDADGAVASIARLDAQLAAQAKKDKAAAAQQATTAASASSGQAQSDAGSAKQAATAAANDARDGEGLAGLGSPAGYAARKIRVAKEDATLDPQVATARTALAMLDSARLGSQSGKSAPGASCDVRKIDWKNASLSFAEGAKKVAFSFHNGESDSDRDIHQSSDGQTNIGGPAVSLDEPRYGDLDADGLEEVVLIVLETDANPPGFASSYAATFHFDKQCKLQHLGSTDTLYSPTFELGKVALSASSVQPSGCEIHQQYALQGGKLPHSQRRQVSVNGFPSGQRAVTRR